MRKLTYEFVKKQFEKDGYTLLSDKYINSRSKLEYICMHGVVKQIRWNNFQQGQGCNCISNNTKYTIDYIRNEFSKLGYILISNKYINAHGYLKYECDKGHKHSIQWTSFQQGHRCPCCYNEDLSVSEDFISDKLNKKGFILIDKNIIDRRTFIYYKCPNNHTHTMRWDEWASDGSIYKCRECWKEDHSLRVSGHNHPNWKGGISFEPYCEAWKDKEYKEAIKQRDNYICQNPICFKTDNVLHIHHINYDKKNCRPNNLITVCRSCNARANFDREWHEEFYKTILKKKFKEEINYVCS